MSNLAVGSFVVHRNMPERGTGKVYCICDKYVRAIFIDDHGVRFDMRPDRSYVQVVAPPEHVARFAGITVQSTSDCKPLSASGTTSKKKAVPPQPAEWTLEQAHDRFLTHYAGGFSSDHYVTAEREWKLNQHRLWNESFAADDLRSLATTDPLAAGELVMRVVQTKPSALLSTRGELPGLSWALRNGAPTPYLLALADVVESPHPMQAHFEAMVAALESIPTSKPGSKVLNWAVLTVVPFLARPDAHMFLKPQVTRDAARKLGVDLLYDASPSWPRYERLLGWSHQLLDFLRPHGARDLIDVQSFIWTIGRPSA